VKNPWLRWRSAFWATRWSVYGIQKISCPRHRRAAIGDTAVVGATADVVGATIVADNDDAHGSVPPRPPLSTGREVSRQGRTFPLAIHFDIGGAGRSFFFGRKARPAAFKANFDTRVADF